jgi:DAK2 domain fusion protein YloV
LLQVLDADAVRRWCAAGLGALQSARTEIDDLNVYPVPDGDTGTNLVLTMESVAEALAGAAGDLASTTGAVAHGALMGARGNSGVILSQLLRGMCEVLAEGGTGEHLQQALVRAAQLGYAAVATPVEGTVLTVAREAAAAAAELGPADLASVVRAARSGAAAALASTPDLLPALRAAGVVDAGGRGLCVLLEALEAVVTGVAAPSSASLLVPRDRSGLATARESGSDEFSYEVQFLLRDSSAEAVDALRDELDRLGDSLVVVGGPDLWNVHVHVNDVGAAVEAGVEAGRPFRITVTRFADQVAEQEEAAAGGPAAPVLAPAARSGRAVVAVAQGDGLAELFAEAGAVVVDGGPTASPSTAELLAAVRSSGAGEVVLLPNDANTRAVAAAAAEAARGEGLAVAVVPTRSVLQGLAALAVADPERLLPDDVGAMAAAAGATRFGEVTTAVREAATMAGICKPGDVLGLIEGDVVVLGQDVEAVGRDLLDRMLAGGGELVTVVTGAQADPGAGDRLTSYVASSHPEVEVVAYDGGQPHYPLLLGVE